MTRVIAYVDCFNLYYGLRAAYKRRYYWLDLVALASNLLKTSQVLSHTHYFTSRIRSSGTNSADRQRQSVYLDALRARPGLTLHQGHFLEKSATCHQCGATWATHEEKMTDVNIAVQLLTDAFDDLFDTALVISGDSDLTTPVRRVRERFPAKRVIVAFPPRRHSSALSAAASGYLTISENNLRQSLLPDLVVAAPGLEFHRPPTWR